MSLDVSARFYAQPGLKVIQNQCNNVDTRDREWGGNKCSYEGKILRSAHLLVDAGIKAHCAFSLASLSSILRSQGSTPMALGFP